MNAPRRLLIGMLILILSPLAVAEQPTSLPTKTFPYKKIKQGALEMIVHYPPGWKEGDQRPAIVFFFGGGWASGSVKQFESHAVYLASRGMVAARADYRVKSRQGVTPKECVEDAKSAVRWVRQNATTLGIDPDRIVAAGGSAGGHIAACTALVTGLDAEGDDTKISSQPNAMVLFNPVLRLDDPKLMKYVGNDEALGKALSSTLYLTKTAPPVLMFYGTADPLKAQGDEFMAKAKELGLKAEMFRAEGQGHGFFNRSPWLETTTQRMDEFLVAIRYLPPKAEVVGVAKQTDAFNIKCDKEGTTVNIVTEAKRSILDISGTGISGATLERRETHWPPEVVLRMHLRGLEFLAISSGDVKVTASVSSHGGHQRLLHLWQDGKEGPALEKDSPYWMEIRMFDAEGKPIEGPPEQGGHFEVALAKAFLTEQPKKLTLAWIDFYR